MIGVGDVVGAGALGGAEMSNFRFKARTMVAVYYLGQVGQLALNYSKPPMQGSDDGRCLLSRTG